MLQPCDKTTNWEQYYKALIDPGLLNFWIDEEAIRERNQRG